MDIKVENGIYIFKYAGRRRIVLKHIIDKFVDERVGKNGLEISEELLMDQLTEIEYDLMMLN